MIDDGNTGVGRNHSGLKHTIKVLHTISVVSESNDASACQGTEIGKFLTGPIARQASGNKRVDNGVPVDSLLLVADGVGAVDRWNGVGHNDYCRKAASGSGGSSAGNVLLMLATRFTEMDVDVDEAGTNDKAGSVDTVDGLGVGHGRQVNEYAISHGQVANTIGTRRRIDDATAGYKRGSGHGGDMRIGWTGE
jgi:hypothetical protein